MVVKKVMVWVCVLAVVCAGSVYASGYMADDDVWVRAVIQTDERGPIDAVWQKGGEDRTAGGDRVIWGHFYASPDDVNWGSRQNPDLFVKIWFDRGGRVDVNFFHVSVPDIDVYSSYRYDGISDQQGTTTLSRRYVRQYYENGQSYSDENYEDGDPPAGYSPSGNPPGSPLTGSLRIGAMINTVEKGLTDAVWHQGGEDTTPRGDRVIWGHFYASPSDVAWGSENNPDLFVKIWFDAGGRVDVNFFHVSVPDIEVCSTLPDYGFYDQKGTTILDNRYIRHEYESSPDPEDEFSMGFLGNTAYYQTSLKNLSAGGFTADIPQKFDWHDEGAVTAVRNQGRCGSCWAFAAVAAFESKIMIRDKVAYDLSEQQQVSCNNDMMGCDGGYLYAPEFWYHQGPSEERCTDYSASDGRCSDVDHCEQLPYRSADYYSVDMNDIDELKASIYRDGPAIFGFAVYSDFSTFWGSGSNGEVYVQSGGYKRRGHAVLAVGWDDSRKALLCKNSWGASGGPNGNGTFWIAYPDQHKNNVCIGASNFEIIKTYDPDKPPDANAGFDQTVDEGDAVTLDGSASKYADSYLWEQTDGPSVSLSNIAAAAPTFTAPNVGSGSTSMTFQLTVSNNSGLQDRDTCTVIVDNKTTTTTTTTTSSTTSTTTSTISTTTSVSTTSSSTTTTIPADETFTNSLGMTFNLIPAGTFMMGSPTDEELRDSDETLHQVTLTQAFYLQTTEVTQGQWEAVMGSNPSYFSNCGDECPVEQVSWDDAQEFITKINQREEGTYRLPTEAEWEYAARAGSTIAFSNGGTTEIGRCYYPNLDAIGWYCGNSDVTYSGCYDGTDCCGIPVCAGTHPVAQKQANAWGLYDMSGNVWEWCHDWYGSYPTGSVTDPTGPDTGSARVDRGGCWFDFAHYCRSGARMRAWSPGHGGLHGFRLVRDIKEK